MSDIRDHPGYDWRAARIAARAPLALKRKLLASPREKASTKALKATSDTQKAAASARPKPRALTDEDTSFLLANMAPTSAGEGGLLAPDIDASVQRTGAEKAIIREQQTAEIDAAASAVAMGLLIMEPTPDPRPLTQADIARKLAKTLAVLNDKPRFDKLMTFPADHGEMAWSAARHAAHTCGSYVPIAPGGLNLSALPPQDLPTPTESSSSDDLVGAGEKRKRKPSRKMAERYVDAPRTRANPSPESSD